MVRNNNFRKIIPKTPHENIGIYRADGSSPVWEDAFSLDNGTQLGRKSVKNGVLLFKLGFHCHLKCN